MNKKHRWIYEPQNSLSLEYDGETLWHSAFSSARSKPFLHPVLSVGGVTISGFEPIDHPWHRGFWFAWKYLNGVNFWEENEHAQSDGATEFVGPETLQLSPEGARLETRLRYVLASGEVLLEENRVMTIGLPQADGTYSFDCEFSFRALQDVLCERTPPSKTEPWGGYAGFGLRAPLDLNQFQILDGEGRHGADVTGQRALGSDFGRG